MRQKSETFRFLLVNKPRYKISESGVKNFNQKCFYRFGLFTVSTVVRPIVCPSRLTTDALGSR